MILMSRLSDYGVGKTAFYLTIVPEKTYRSKGDRRRRLIQSNEAPGETDVNINFFSVVLRQNVKIFFVFDANTSIFLILCASGVVRMTGAEHKI